MLYFYHDNFSCFIKEKDTPTILQKLSVKLSDDDECAEEYPDSFRSKTQICARSDNEYKNAGFCPGDSGGPLICIGREEEQYQVGIVAYDEKGCLLTGNSGVYTYVPPFFSWIKEVISGNFL